jgi:hypothetical protein
VLARRIRFLRRENIMHRINAAAATPRAPMLKWLLMADTLPMIIHSYEPVSEREWTLKGVDDPTRDKLLEDVDPRSLIDLIAKKGHSRLYQVIWVRG